MAGKNFIGRAQEQAVLQASLASNEAEMVAVIGRRRVGKTFLIKNTFADRIAFEVTGVQNAEMAEQMQNFAFRINKFFCKSLGQKKIRLKWNALGSPTHIQV